MRAPSLSDFPIVVDGVGAFSFARRTLGDAIKIRGDYLRLCGELGEGDKEISAYANIISSLNVLCVSAPAGWEDIELLDLTGDDDVLNRLIELFEKLRGAEDSFRQAKISKGKA